MTDKWSMNNMRLVEWDAVDREIATITNGDAYHITVEVVGGASFTGAPWRVVPTQAIVRIDLTDGSPAFVAISAITAVVLVRL